MTQLIPQNFGQVSKHFQNVQVEDDLSAGIQSSFGMIGYRGKVWSIRYRGDELQLMREDGDGPKSSIEVVILKSPKSISKIFYEQGYVEGSNAAPDCFSNNGIYPDPTSQKKQSETCATCPHNQWGSRITPAGKQGKACSDNKRVAVVPLGDISNEMFGGPMLLRIPAASLQDLAMFGQKMQQMGYPYYSIGTRIQFDPNESYPKFKFSAIRPLTDEEAELVLTLRDGHTVERILSENEFAVTAPTPAAETPEQVFEQPPAQKVQAAQPAQAAVTGFGGAAAPVGNGTVTPSEPAQNAVQAQEKSVEETVAATTASPSDEEESDEDREARELEEQLAALKAKKAAAAKAKKAEGAKAAKAAKAAEAEAKPAPEPEVTSEGTSDNVASDFEANLDKMLADLLPS